MVIFGGKPLSRMGGSGARKNRQDGNEKPLTAAQRKKVQQLRARVAECNRNRLRMIQAKEMPWGLETRNF